MSTLIRQAEPKDAEACGKVVFEAFGSIASQHGFPSDFPEEELAINLMKGLIADPSIFGVVAEIDDTVVGSNFLIETDEIRGVGPITVAPTAQRNGVGRQLMHAVLSRADGAAGIRLLQDAFNMTSLALYASLGFEVREPVVVVAGHPTGSNSADCDIRPMNEGDLDSCNELCGRINGVSRYNELAEAIQRLAPLVAVRGRKVTAYMTAPSFWIANHGVAESVEDMQTLILGAAELSGPVSFLLPSRQTNLLNWCLSHGLKAVKPMTIMSKGKYQEPGGPYLPSVFY